jgi:hypothetical protein
VKVYIVWMGCYEERHIERVFARRKSAERHAEALRDHPKMSQWERESVEVDEVEVVER